MLRSHIKWKNHLKGWMSDSLLPRFSVALGLQAPLMKQPQIISAVYAGEQEWAFRLITE